MIELSIIIPLYNSEKYLSRCIDSLLFQDIPKEDYEIILINDGSPDGSLTLALSYASHYTNIVVISQDNKGTSGARNTGLRHANGKYVCFIDPDDYVLENSLGCILNQMNEESLDILRFGYTEVNEDYQPTKSCKYAEVTDYSPKIMDGCSFMSQRLGVACYVWTYIFRTSLIIDNGLFFIEGDYFDDTPWLPRVLQKARRVNSTNLKRHFYLIRNNSLVQSNNKEAIDKKISGHQFLIDELTRQNNSCICVNAKKWYKMMISHCVLSLLTLVGLYRIKSYRMMIRFIRSKNVFPLSLHKTTSINRLKLILLSISPGLYCWLIHIKYSPS